MQLGWRHSKCSSHRRCLCLRICKAEYWNRLPAEECCQPRFVDREWRDLEPIQHNDYITWWISNRCELQSRLLNWMRLSLQNLWQRSIQVSDLPPLRRWYSTQLLPRRHTVNLSSRVSPRLERKQAESVWKMRCKVCDMLWIKRYLRYMQPGNWLPLFL